MTQNQYYRLLSKGEALLDDDEFWSMAHHCWFPTRIATTSDLSRPDPLYRRKITMPEWRPNNGFISFYAVLAIGGGSKWPSLVYPVAGRLSGNWTHWMPLPDPPPPAKSAEELAFEKHYGDVTPQQHYELLRSTWLAALEFAKGQH